MIRKAFISILILTFFVSCSYKKSAADGNSAHPPVNQPDINSPPKAKPTSPTNLPTDSSGDLKPAPVSPPSNVRPLMVSFVQTRITVNSKKEAHVELQLSQPAKKPVIVEVYLRNGSAIYHRDFTGFKLRSASIKAETRQTLIFAPKVRRLRLPIIGVRNTTNCNTEFYIKINKNSEFFQVKNETARIYIPCNEN